MLRALEIATWVIHPGVAACSMTVTIDSKSTTRFLFRVAQAADYNVRLRIRRKTTKCGFSAASCHFLRSWCTARISHKPTRKNALQNELQKTVSSTLSVSFPEDWKPLYCHVARCNVRKSNRILYFCNSKRSLSGLDSGGYLPSSEVAKWTTTNRHGDEKVFWYKTNP